MIGKIIRSTDSEFNTIQVETSTKEDGVVIKDMGKELCGYVMPKTNSGGSTQVIGKTITKRVEERCSISQAIDMTVCGWKIFLMGKAE